MRATYPFLLVACLACGPASRPHAHSPASAPASAPASQRARTGVITRAELKGFLDRGMPAFIANVVVDRYPRARAHRFRGWRIVEFFPGDVRFANVDIKPGDVILRINERPIERPDQFVAVWTALKLTKELVVETQRAGQMRQGRVHRDHQVQLLDGRGGIAEIPSLPRQINQLHAGRIRGLQAEPNHARQAR